jgi:digeranylgeranylglycerophospholipid reductase
VNYAKEWDVIIVGAGPGGNRCARAFAEKGVRTLVIDRKQQIGPPKRCGEGLSKRWVEISGLKPTPRWATQPIDGAILVSPTGKKITVSTSGTTGYIIERSQFEKLLAEEAIRAGAKFMLKARVFEVLKEGDQVVGVKVMRDGKEEEYRSKILVAADGVDSLIPRYAGINSTMSLSECDAGYQYEMAGVPLLDPKKMELYFGKDVAPRGYVWIFPKGKDVGNVGIGVMGADLTTAKFYLDRWLEQNKERFKNASVTEINAGVIHVTAPIKKFYGNGIMVIGDAARMVNPIHGGGMGATMEAGIMAAEVGAAAIKKGDTSERELKKYQDQWERVRGNEFKAILKVRQFFEKLNDKQMEIIAEAVDPQVFIDLGHGKGLGTVVKTLIAKSPDAAKFAMSFLTGD